MIIYNLYIDCQNAITHEKVSELLGRSQDEDLCIWSLTLKQKDNDEFIDFTKIFHELLTPNMKSLARIGITSDDIIIWVVYEYFKQCALGFNPYELKRISDLNVSLNIDCHEVSKPT